MTVTSARSACFEDRFDRSQVFVVCSPHRPHHHGCHNGSKTRGLPPISKSHAGPFRGPLRCLPLVGGFHWEGPLEGLHHQAFSRLELDEGVRIVHRLAHELRNERNLGSHCGRRIRKQSAARDVRVPLSGVRRVCRVARDLLDRSVDHNLGEHVYGHLQRVDPN